MVGNPAGISIMGVVDSLEETSARANAVMLNAENKLKVILDLAIENGDKDSVSIKKLVIRTSWIIL